MVYASRMLLISTSHFHYMQVFISPRGHLLFVTNLSFHTKHILYCTLYAFASHNTSIPEPSLSVLRPRLFLFTEIICAHPCPTPASTQASQNPNTEAHQDTPGLPIHHIVSLRRKGCACKCTRLAPRRLRSRFHPLQLCSHGLKSRACDVYTRK
jgi:hypothetical protein